jgi:hypothetical protein
MSCLVEGLSIASVQVSIATMIEGTDSRGKIHLSQATADLIASSGKGHWVTPREETIDLIKLRCIQTYWLKPREESGRTPSPKAAAFDTHEYIVFVDETRQCKLNTYGPWGFYKQKSEKER